jgi:hypothetical protein
MYKLFFPRNVKCYVCTGYEINRMCRVVECVCVVVCVLNVSIMVRGGCGCGLMLMLNQSRCLL